MSEGMPWTQADQDEYEEVFYPAISDDELRDLPKMARSCIGCPARDGTEASRTITTVGSLATCIRRRHPFWCHMTTEPGPMGDRIPTRTCRAWLDGIASTSEGKP